MKMAIFHELNFGGAKRTIIEFAKKLKKNHIVDLYYVDENKDKVANFFNKAYYYKFNSKIWKGNNWKARLYKDTIELIKLYKLHKAISEEIKRKKYDYVFVHPSKYTQAPFLLKFLKNKCIYFCQEPLRMVYDPFISSDINGIVFPKNIYEFLIRKVRKRIDLNNFRSASIVLSNSNFSKNIIEKFYRRGAEVCYLGVDAGFFKPQSIDKSIDILFIGNKDKGFRLLNESLKFFKIKPKVYAIFRKDGKPNISDKELVGVYNKSKILVALNQDEPFGLIPLEAMACGTPVIAIEEGGYKESVVDKKTGFLISRDPKNLYEKINKIINDDELRSNMVKTARAHILKNWTWDKSVKRFLEIVKYAK